jgi:hypothetical protein
MIAFPITDLLDDRIWTLWLERYLHPSGLPCPSCGSTAQRLCRAQGHFPASRGRACQGYDILLPGPVCANTRQRPGTLVLLLRGMAKGRADSALDTGVRPLTHTAPYAAATHPGPSACDGPHRDDGCHRRRSGGTVPERRGKTAPRIWSPPTRPVGAPLNGKGMAPRPTIAPDHPCDLAGDGRTALVEV